MEPQSVITTDSISVETPSAKSGNAVYTKWAINDDIWRVYFCQMNGNKMAAFLTTLASNVRFMTLINEAGAVRLSFLKQRVHMYTQSISSHLLPCSSTRPQMSYGWNYLFGENAITKWEGPLWVSQVLNMDSLLVMKLPWVASKFKGNFLLLCWLCSSSNFVYSNHVGVMQWAHNSSAAALSHQVSDLRMWSCENVNYTTWGPGCVSSTCDIRRRLFNIWYCRVSSCHHDTSIGLTNSMEIPWCAVLFWNTQVRIQYPVICPVSWVKLYPQFPHLATTLVSWTTATHHLENNLRRPTPPFRWLLGTCLVSQRKHWSQACFILLL